MPASDDLWAGVLALSEARPGYEQAQAYYDGDVPEVFASARYRRALERTGIDFDANFAATPVDAVVNRLELAAVTSPDKDQADTISVIWDANSLGMEAHDVHRRACEYGDSYLIVLPTADGTGVEMHYNSPLTVRAMYSEENPREVRYVVKRWAAQTPLGPVLRAELYYTDHTERWTTRPGGTGGHEKDWFHWLALTEAPVDDGEPSEPDPESWWIPHTWDWEQIPAFHFRTDRPYGVPEHRRAYGSQNAINKLNATHMGTVDYQGFPQRYALTETATTDTGDLDPSDFDDDFPPEPAGPTDSGDDSSLKSGPGEVMLLRGFKAVGQFDAARPEVFLDPIMFRVRAMAQFTTTPLHLFDPSGEQPSGESLRRKEAPFVKKVRNRQSMFETVWKAAFRFALRLLGYTDPQVDVRWVTPTTTDDKDGWETAEKKTARGVPNRQILLEAGYGEDQVQAWLESPIDDEAELARRLEAVASLSESAQRLGTAVTLGAIDSEQAQALLGPLIVRLTASGPEAG